MSPSPTPSSGLIRLAPDEVQAHLAQRPAALVLDARDEQAHARSHWPGSVRLDGRNHERLLMREARDRPVFLYCHHGNASQTYGGMFVDFGFTDVADLVGGWTAWEQARTPAAPARPVPDALARWLEAEGFDATAPERPGRHGNTPLMHAAWRGQHHRVDELLDLGVSLEAVNGDGNNALWLACVHGEPGLIRALVGRGVPIDHQNAAGASCLMYAASAGKPQVVETLLALGANPRLTSQDDWTALDMAASIECLQLLRSPA
ncbi:ankyrin repeat protein [Sphaerotilus hippei]|uniref:Ankyrin repeat protein n=1 Tax=Sphaerotilus hippei TaxID=744406 RepID=A0A318GXA0_9BURK|nr:ankyrin repeat domain-containing protein [Sphaerotilus hippei]PXW94363.1 ankyrin repeat protein [Sphaerotilus hippei]